MHACARARVRAQIIQPCKKSLIRKLEEIRYVSAENVETQTVSEMYSTSGRLCANGTPVNELIVGQCMSVCASNSLFLKVARFLQVQPSHDEFLNLSCRTLFTILRTLFEYSLALLLAFRYHSTVQAQFL